MHVEIVTTNSFFGTFVWKVTNECDIGDLVVGGGVSGECAKHPAVLYLCQTLEDSPKIVDRRYLS